MVDAITSGLSNSLNGLFKAEERLVKSADRISSGDISAENMVETKLASSDVKAQAKVIKALRDAEDEIINILA